MILPVIMCEQVGYQLNCNKYSMSGCVFAEDFIQYEAEKQAKSRSGIENPIPAIFTQLQNPSALEQRGKRCQQVQWPGVKTMSPAATQGIQKTHGSGDTKPSCP